MAPTHDRDPAMDTLLSRAMRDTEAHGVAALESRATSDRCPDAEILAAWFARGLRASALSGVEAHVASCTRCQASVAALALTDPTDDGIVFAARPWWRARWLVPALAAAAVVVVYVNTRPGPGPDLMQARVEEVANAPAATGGESPRAGTQERAGATIQTGNNPLSTPAAATGRPIGQAQNRTSADTAQGPRALSPQPSSTAATPAPTGEEILAGQAREPAMTQAQQGSVTAAESALGAARAEIATAPGPPSAARQLPPPGTPPSAGDLARRAQAASPSPEGPLELRTSAGVPRWRVWSSGQVERSADGVTWRPLGGVVSPGMRAGSSPSANVCWFVGTSGVVWMTEDGLSFRRVPFPESVDLVRVTATDARTASATTIDGRVFRTTDQGQTWLR